MFNRLKSAFSKFSKQAEDDVEEKEITGEELSEGAPKEEKRGIFGVLTKTKLSGNKFDDLFDDLEEELLQLNVAAEVVDLMRVKLNEE